MTMNHIMAALICLTMLFGIGVLTWPALAQRRPRRPELGVPAPPRKNETDPPDGRSGLSLFTDHRTGIQYVGARGYGLVPRLGPNGDIRRQGDGQ
jgi:hypothetical protein